MNRNDALASHNISDEEKLASRRKIPVTTAASIKDVHESKQTSIENHVLLCSSNVRCEIQIEQFIKNAEEQIRLLEDQLKEINDLKNAAHSTSSLLSNAKYSDDEKLHINSKINKYFNRNISNNLTIEKNLRNTTKIDSDIHIDETLPKHHPSLESIVEITTKEPSTQNLSTNSRKYLIACPCKNYISQARKVKQKSCKQSRDAQTSVQKIVTDHNKNLKYPNLSKQDLPKLIIKNDLAVQEIPPVIVLPDPELQRKFTCSNVAVINIEHPNPIQTNSSKEFEYKCVDTATYIELDENNVLENLNGINCEKSYPTAATQCLDSNTNEQNTNHCKINETDNKKNKDSMTKSTQITSCSNLNSDPDHIVELNTDEPRKNKNEKTDKDGTIKPTPQISHNLDTTYVKSYKLVTKKHKSKKCKPKKTKTTDVNDLLKFLLEQNNKSIEYNENFKKILTLLENLNSKNSYNQNDIDLKIAAMTNTTKNLISKTDSTENKKNVISDASSNSKIDDKSESSAIKSRTENCNCSTDNRTSVISNKNEKKSNDAGELEKCGSRATKKVQGQTKFNNLLDEIDEISQSASNKREEIALMTEFSDFMKSFDEEIVKIQDLDEADLCLEQDVLENHVIVAENDGINSKNNTENNNAKDSEKVNLENFEKNLIQTKSAKDEQKLCELKNENKYIVTGSRSEAKSSTNTNESAKPTTTLLGNVQNVDRPLKTDENSKNFTTSDDPQFDEIKKKISLSFSLMETNKENLNVTNFTSSTPQKQKNTEILTTDEQTLKDNFHLLSSISSDASTTDSKLETKFKKLFNDRSYRLHKSHRSLNPSKKVRKPRPTQDCTCVGKICNDLQISLNEICTLPSKLPQQPNRNVADEYIKYADEFILDNLNSVRIGNMKNISSPLSNKDNVRQGSRNDNRFPVENDLSSLTSISEGEIKRPDCSCSLGEIHRCQISNESHYLTFSNRIDQLKRNNPQVTLTKPLMHNRNWYSLHMQTDNSTSDE